MGCGGSSKEAREAGGEAGSASGLTVKVVLSLDFAVDRTSGDVVVDVHPDWAPLGAQRFLEMVDDGYFDGCKIYRVVPGFMAQWGIHGDTSRYNQWKDRKIKDDPVKKSNTRGTLSFATSGPDCRSCQIFVNFGKNSSLDSQGFSPFGEVVTGIENIDKIFSGYGESEPKGEGPNQNKVKEGGDSYLQKFPKLTVIQSAMRAEVADVYAKYGTWSKRPLEMLEAPT